MTPRETAARLWDLVAPGASAEVLELLGKVVAHAEIAGRQRRGLNGPLSPEELDESRRHVAAKLHQYAQTRPGASQTWLVEKIAQATGIPPYRVRRIIREKQNEGSARTSRADSGTLPPTLEDNSCAQPMQ